MKTVLFTRALSNEEKMLLRKNNISPVVIPFIEYRDQVLTDEERAELCSFQGDCIILTSPRAVPAFIRFFENKEIPSIFTNSPAVSRMLNKKKIPHVLKSGYVKDLARFIIKEHHPKHVLYLCSNIRLQELKNILTEEGIRLVEIIVYQTSIQNHLVNVAYEGIVFMSPSAVKGFFDKNKLPKGVAVFVMGETTAREIENYSPTPVIMPVKKEFSSIVNMINNVIKG